MTREYTGRILPRGNVNVVYRRGASSFDASLSHQVQNMLSEKGFDRRTELPSGTELEYRAKRIRNTEPFTVAALGWAHEQNDVRSAHVNAKVSFDKWTMLDVSDVTGPAVPYDSQLYTEDHLWRTYKLSGDLTRPLAGGALKFNALATHRHRRNDDIFTESVAGSSIGGFVQDFDDYRDERLVRLAWRHDAWNGWTAEIGAEGAFNRLRTDLNIFTIDAAGDQTPVDLPIDDAIVSEYRGEAFVNAGRAIASRLRLDLAVSYELSRLTVTGDAEARRTLGFLKPKAALNWTGAMWHFQLSAERTVAQLRFQDFVSSASFNTGQVNGGNAELQPQRKWEFLLTADRTILGDGRVKLDLGHNAVSLVQDRIPLLGVDPVTGELVNTGLDAPGNLSSGSEWIARANVDLPLATLGIVGGRLNLTGSFLDTSVEDPYTLEQRPFSGARLFTYTASFRQDLASFAWGVEGRGQTGATFYRLRELDRLHSTSPGINAFVEYRPSGASTVTFGVENLIDASSRRWRTFFLPDRTSPVPVEREYRERSSHRQFYLSLRHSFG